MFALHLIILKLFSDLLIYNILYKVIPILWLSYYAHMVAYIPVGIGFLLLSKDNQPFSFALRYCTVNNIPAFSLDLSSINKLPYFISTQPFSFFFFLFFPLSCKFSPFDANLIICRQELLNGGRRGAEQTIARWCQFSWRVFCVMKRRRQFFNGGKWVLYCMSFKLHKT